MDLPIKDKASPVNFTSSVEDVHEAVKTVSYSQRAAAKKAKTEALKGKGKPLGGAEPIPEGKLAPITMPRPDFGDEEPPPINQSEAEQRAQKKRLSGVGSAYDVNQRLASGELKKPVSVSEAKKTSKSKLSPGTMEAIKQMDRSVKETTPVEVEAPSPQLPPMPAPLPTEEVERKKLEESDKDLERQFPVDIEGILTARNALLSEERRKDIEDQLDNLNIADMITKREIVQNIPVVPGQFEITLRTLSQKENLFCLHYVYEFHGSESYIQELHNTAKLVCSLVGINGAVLPDHRKNVGQREEEVDRKDFEVKLDLVTAYPVQLVADISVQLIWFNGRVNALFNTGNLKNG